VGLLREIFVRQYAGVPKQEWPKALLLSAFFFLVIATYWILKPLKRSLIINYFGDQPLRFLGATLEGAEAEQVGKVMNMIFAYLLVVLFTWLARRFRREYLVLIFAAAFSLAFVSYAAVIARPNDLIVWSFYVLGDMFNTAMVVLFWAYTNDLTSAAGARRTYGIIGLGGVVGGFAGATVVNSYVQQLGRAPLLLLCVVPMALVSAIAFATRGKASGAVPADDEDRREGKRGIAMEGARLVFRSRYLLGIAGIVGCYELVSSIVDYQLAATVERLIHDDLGKDAFFGLVGQMTGLGSICVQFLLTGFVMRTYGVRTSLLFLPAAVLVSSVGFLIFPVLAFAAAMSASDNALNYSINQSAKEVLYTPNHADVKYKAKAFIDMFVQRAAKVLAVVLNLAYAALVAEGVRWLSLILLAIVAYWFVLVFAVSRGFRIRAARTERPADIQGLRAA
jgi:AAA family ATP:ADP antiporter